MRNTQHVEAMGEDGEINFLDRTFPTQVINFTDSGVEVEFVYKDDILDVDLILTSQGGWLGINITDFAMWSTMPGATLNNVITKVRHHARRLLPHPAAERIRLLLLPFCVHQVSDYLAQALTLTTAKAQYWAQQLAPLVPAYMDAQTNYGKQMLTDLQKLDQDTKVIASPFMDSLLCHHADVPSTNRSPRSTFSIRQP